MQWAPIRAIRRALRRQHNAAPAGANNATPSVLEGAETAAHRGLWTPSRSAPCVTCPVEATASNAAKSGNRLRFRPKPIHPYLMIKRQTYIDGLDVTDAPWLYDHFDQIETVDAVLIGGGIMSATLGALLTTVQPGLVDRCCSSVATSWPMRARPRGTTRAPGTGILRAQLHADPDDGAKAVDAHGSSGSPGSESRARRNRRANRHFHSLHPASRHRVRRARR